MRLLITGSHGLVGNALLSYLQEEGHDVVRLVRNRAEESSSAVYWNPIGEDFCAQQFEGFDGVVHLAGASILCRWTKKRREQLFRSRCRDTWMLAQMLSRLKHPPKTFFSASAVGFYGDRGGELLTEESSRGEGFLSEMTGEWEKASRLLQHRGVRLIYGRFGLILSAKGGVLSKMIPIYRLGLGASFGSGQQMMSWVALEDVVRAIAYLLERPSLSGVFNITAPNPVSQGEFSKALAKALHRRAMIRLPAWLLKLLCGEQMAQELLLSGCSALPKHLAESGFSFLYPQLSSALSRELS